MLRTADKRMSVGRKLSGIVNPSYAGGFADAHGVSSFSSFGPMGLSGLSLSSVASAAWPAANRAIFIPVRIPTAVVADKIVVGFGGTAGGNFDAGIYSVAGARLVSTGTTARTLSSEVSVDITDTLLRPGVYFLALALDGTNTVIGKTPGQVTFSRMFGVRMMETAFVLPTTATYATIDNAFVPNVMVLTKPLAMAPSLRPPSIPPLLVITPYHLESFGTTLASNGASMNTASNGTLGGANVVQYMPFRIYESSVAVKMSAFIGGTSAGNIDVGIYDYAGRKLVSSGTTAVGTINTLQVFDIADTRLGPGTYYMAATLSDATATVFRTALSDENVLGSWPAFSETPGAFGLPTTASYTMSTAGTLSNPAAIGVHFDTLA